MKDKKIIVCIIIIGFLLFTTILFYAMYKIAIQEGAKNTVAAIEMTTACMSLGNFTNEQLVDKYYEMFVKPRLVKG